MHNAKYLYILLALIFLTCSSPQPPTEQKDVIAISWYYPNNAFQGWLLKHDPELEFVNIYDLPDDQIDAALADAEGYLLTGGCDVAPALHGHAGEEERCGKLDPRRDSLELLMAARSFELKKPILGVCRGMQVMNIQAGGDLIIDLPTDRNTEIHQQEGGDILHEVLIDSTGYLFEVSRCLASVVRSNHHQAVGRLGEGYEVLAYAPDSVIEAFHFADKSVHPFALGVHWHPERMQQRDPLAGPIARAFLEHCD